MLFFFSPLHYTAWRFRLVFFLCTTYISLVIDGLRSFFLRIVRWENLLRTRNIIITMECLLLLWWFFSAIIMYTVDECWKFVAKIAAKMLGGYCYYFLGLAWFEHRSRLVVVFFVRSSVRSANTFFVPCVCVWVPLCWESNKYGTIIDIRSNATRLIRWSLKSRQKSGAHERRATSRKKIAFTIYIYLYIYCLFSVPFSSVDKSVMFEWQLLE